MARRARPRILIVGCGAVGLVVARILAPRCHVFALSRSDTRDMNLRSMGVTPLHADLDDPATLYRITGLADHVIHLAPPSPTGSFDKRTRHLLASLGPVRALAYVSTTGVYGDCGGARIDETRTTNPQSERAVRRVDAELVLRAWAQRRQVRLTVLRAPGIYGHDRLPLRRLIDGLPVLRREEDIYSNHIHMQDLARMIVAALSRGAALRTFNACDSSEMLMGDYFDLVADAKQLPRPPRRQKSDLPAFLSEMQLSFMRESRRISNSRILSELGIALRYPSVAEALR